MEGLDQRQIFRVGGDDDALRQIMKKAQTVVGPRNQLKLFGQQAQQRLFPQDHGVVGWPSCREVALGDSPSSVKERIFWRRIFVAKVQNTGLVDNTTLMGGHDRPVLLREKIFLYRGIHEGRSRHGVGDSVVNAREMFHNHVVGL